MERKLLSTEVPEYLANVLKDVDKVYIGDLPSLADEGAALALAEGMEDTRYFGGLSIERPYVNVTIRSKNYKEGMQKAQTIKDQLDGYSDDLILQCLASGSPFYVGRNEQKLHVIQLLLKIEIKE